ncbi:hypothetical protein OEA41_009391 [Lepraria neglecta]|uniref:Uncharacterized protein n=1 Tax=Lepraria neglecta TaxID=209136 RepID=A0AAE0DHL2_9LECA|nr:hypothetical protein OEA41_009391 [Lepraria neglecta]
MASKQEIKSKRTPDVPDIVRNLDIEDIGKLASPCGPTQHEMSDYNTCALKDACGKPTESTGKVAMSTMSASRAKGDKEYFQGRGMAKDKYVPVYQQPRVRLPAWKLKAETKKSRSSKEICYLIDILQRLHHSDKISGTVVEKPATKETTFTTKPSTSDTGDEVIDCSNSNTLTNAKALFDNLVAGACSSVPTLPSTIDLAWSGGHSIKDFLIESADETAVDSTNAEESLLHVGGEIAET